MEARIDFVSKGVKCGNSYISPDKKCRAGVDYQPVPPKDAFDQGLRHIKATAEETAHALADIWQSTLEATGARRIIPQMLDGIQKMIDEKEIHDGTAQAFAATTLLANDEAKNNGSRGAGFVDAQERLAYMEALVNSPERSAEFKKSLALFAKRPTAPPYPEELAALRYYSTVRGYKEMNMHLRGADERLERVMKEQYGDTRTLKQIKRDADQDIKMINSALNGLPPYEGKTYRGLTLPEEVVAEFAPSKTWTEKGFTSTTKSLQGRYPGNVVMSITSKSGRDISEFEAYPNREVLFKPNTRYAITSKRRVSNLGREFWLIDMEEVATRRDAEDVQPQQKQSGGNALKTKAMLAVKQMLETAFRDGVDRLLSADVDEKNAIVGQFLDEQQVYDYTISEAGEIDYVEADSRSDSYWSGWVERLDVVAGKPRSCEKGKSCGDTCIAKGVKCRQQLPQQAKAVLPQVRQALGGKATSPKPQQAQSKREQTKPQGQATATSAGSQNTAQSQQQQQSQEKPPRKVKEESLAVGSLSGAAVVGALGLTAFTIARDLKRLQIKDFNSIRQPPGGIPDEETLKEYDTFQPGDLIRKNFTAPGWGNRQHYGVYYGKDPETGEHLMVDTGILPDGTTGVVLGPLKSAPNSTQYAKVPESEMRQRKGTKQMSQAEIVERINRTIGSKFAYQSFDSNCESFARGIVEGAAYSTQGDRVTAFTKFIANPLTERMGSTKVSEKPMLEIGALKIPRIEYSRDEFRLTAQQMVKYLEQRQQEDMRRARGDADEFAFETTPDGAFESVLLDGSSDVDWDNPATLMGLKDPKDYATSVEDLAAKFPGVGNEVRTQMYKNYMMMMLGLTAENSPVATRTDADGDGKPCGNGYISKDKECKQQGSVFYQAQSATGGVDKKQVVKNLAILGAAVGGYLAINAADRKYQISDTAISGAARLAFAGTTAVDLDGAIEKLPASKEQKAKARDLVGASKVALVKTINEREGSELVSISPDSNSYTYKMKGGSYRSVTSVGSKVLVYTSSKRGTLDGQDVYGSMFTIDNTFDHKPGDRAEGLQLARNAKVMFNEHLALAKDGSYFIASVHKGDDAGSKRQSIYEKSGFVDAPPQVGKDLIWAVKSNGKLTAPYRSKAKGEFVGNDNPLIWEMVGETIGEAKQLKQEGVLKSALQDLWRSRKDSIIPTPEVAAMRQRTALLLRLILNRAYQDGVDLVFDIKADDGILSGLFLDESRVFEFMVDTDTGAVAYKKATGVSRSRVDSIATQIKLDAPKKRQCTVGISCGGSCISNQKTCQIGLSKLASPNEIELLVAAVNMLQARRAQPVASIQSPEVQPVAEATAATEVEPDPLDALTIRQLKKMASGRVVGYSAMNKEQLKAAIKAVEADPSQQERLKKTLERAEETRNLDPVNDWRRVVKSQKEWNAKDVTTAIQAGGVLLGIGLSTYAYFQEKYRGNFAVSANAALSRAKTIDVPAVGNKQFFTFTVDGFSADADSRKGKRLSDKLEEVAPGFMNRHHVIPIDGNEFTDVANLPPDTPGVLRSSVKTVMATARSLSTSLIRGSNPQAVELAAQVLAYRQKYPAKPINLAGFGAGGMIVNEATEILNAVDKNIVKDLRVTNVGTPHFGLTTQRAGLGDGKGRHMTVTSANDPLNMFPTINPVTVNTVRVHSVDAYLDDDRARKMILDGLGQNDPPLTRKPKPKKKAKPAPKPRGDSESYLSAFRELVEV